MTAASLLLRPRGGLLSAEGSLPQRGARAVGVDVDHPRRYGGDADQVGGLEEPAGHPDGHKHKRDDERQLQHNRDGRLAALALALLRDGAHGGALAGRALAVGARAVR